MDQLVQCPVCTLFLHNGMSLESHLDTHPKDQVIKALCNLTSKGSSCGSRTSTPLNSERSYRSRSRTPATEDSSRWTSSHRSTDHERYWRRTPSRTPKTNPTSSLSRNSTPDIRLGEINFETASTTNSTTQHSSPFITKVDKTQQTYQASTLSEYDQHYVYFPDSQEDREIKYSRSAEYAALDNTNNLFTYNMPTMGAGIKLLPAVPRRSNDIVKIVPKSNNILLKTNVGGVQYIGAGVKPMHVVVPTAPTFVQKTQNNMIVTGKLPPNVQMQMETKAPLHATNQLHQMPPNTFAPSTTVVTTNSQIIYQEMVHNIDGKPFITSMPTVLGGHDNVADVAQASSMYQNVMVVDPFGNASCMYPTPQQIVPKVCPTSVYNDASPLLTGMQIDRPIQDVSDAKSLIIDEGPILPPPPDIDPNINCEVIASSMPQPGISAATEKVDKVKKDNVETKSETQGSTNKGLKILSNIKVEVPVQHHKNMVNTIMDLTGSSENDYSICSASPEKILPDLQDNNMASHFNKISNLSATDHSDHISEPERILPDFEDNIQILSDENTQPSMSSADSIVSNTFSVIKNVGNPPSYKDFNKTVADTKIETEFSDSCPVPDLICNEKPSISPCSELSEMGDNSTDHTSISPNAGSSQTSHKVIDISEKKLQNPPKSRQNALRLNNIYVKKNKKVLQIKNSKSSPAKGSSHKEIEPAPSSSTCKSPENFFISKMHQNRINNPTKVNNRVLLTISVEEVKEGDHNVFDADTEEQSMDIEPVASSTLHNSNELSSGETVCVKEEVNSSNEGGFSNETGASGRGVTPMETLRPINVITYGNMSSADFNDESNDRELLDLEATTKNRQFVSMMNENYFGDNIYADYFTPDRVESFDSARESSIWGESSQKENEFVLPNFIHESYKIAESNGIDYSELGCREKKVEAIEVCEPDSKVDLLSERSESEVPLNICADERMPSRGELSGQESNGDMESPWSTMYAEGAPSEPYDLIARESWVSDGSEMDAAEKRDTLEEELQFAKSRLLACAQCGAKCASPKELRAHRAHAHAHAPPACAAPKTTYSRLITARTIKKEKQEKITLANNLLTLDSKESITSTILQVYENMESKPKLEALIKQEPKRKRRDYVCPTCKVDQLSDAAFHEHLKIHPLECLTCGKCFFRRSNLALHIKTHLGIKNYKCEVCEKRFITRQKLMEHHNVHTGRAPIKCTVCSDTFRRFSNMVQHRDRHHKHKRGKIRDYVCHCGAVFHSRAKLLWHKETHDEKPKACLYCSDKFVHAASLTRHVRRSHNEFLLTDKLKGKSDNVSCPVCKQVYLRSNLRSHLLTHSGQRPYHCIICNKYFTTKWNLKIHRWTHMSRSSKPFKCNLCKSAFIRHTEYISHMNAHKSVKPYTCNYCGCQFIRKYNCQRHLREHETAKKYVCKVPECGKSFHRRYYLSEHMKVHSGARPFSCNICGKTSNNKSNHNKHVKIHHAREPVATEA